MKNRSPMKKQRPKYMPEIMIRFLWIGVVLLLMGGGCVSNHQAGQDADSSTASPESQTAMSDTSSSAEDIVSGVGTVRYVDLEGGFYGIVADDGARYNPDSLEESFRRDGLRVRFRARVQEDVMTVQMWGQPVELLDVTRVKS